MIAQEVVQPLFYGQWCDILHAISNIINLIYSRTEWGSFQLPLITCLQGMRHFRLKRLQDRSEGFLFFCEILSIRVLLVLDICLISGRRWYLS